MMLVLFLLLTTDTRIEKLQTVITNKIAVEVEAGDEHFFRIWQTMENYRWEQEKLHWVILDSLTRISDSERIFNLMKKMRSIDSVYTRKIFQLQDSLFKYMDKRRVDQFLKLRKKIDRKIKVIIREIRSGED